MVDLLQLEPSEPEHLTKLLGGVQHAAESVDLVIQKLVDEHLAVPQVGGEHQDAIGDENSMNLADCTLKPRPGKVLDRIEPHHQIE